MTQKTALIAWGGWEGHTPERSANIVRDMLEKHGFEVNVVHGTAAYADPSLHDLNLIVPMITMSDIAKDELDNLTAAVRGGVGLAGFHGTMCDSFRKETEYQFMTGGQWVSHPGNIIDYTVNITRPDDPVMAGIKDFPYRSEQYYMHFDPSNEVLATTTFPASIWTSSRVWSCRWSGRRNMAQAGCSIQLWAIRPMNLTCRK